MLIGQLFAGQLFRGGLFKGSLFGVGGSVSLAALITALFGNDEQGGLWLPGPHTCWKDAERTQPCTAPGDLVYRMDDLSGRGNHATQATEAARPALQQTAGGLWYLAFDGTDDSLQTSSMLFMSSLNGGSAVAGIKRTTSAGQRLILNMDINPRYWQIMEQKTATQNLRSAFISEDITVFTNAAGQIPADAPSVARSQLLPNSIEVFLNTASNGATAITKPLFAASNPIFIGSYAGASLFFGGELYAAVVRDEPLTAAQIADTEAFVAARSGVTLP